MTKTPTKRAVIYCRLSPTVSETKAENLAQQEEKCRARCEDKGWDVVEVITDRDTSATKGHRPGWFQVVAMIHAGRVDVVVARHPDRMYRQMRELEDLVDLSEQTGVMLATTEGDYDLTTPTGKLTARVLAAAARGEMEMKAARQKLGHERRAKAGKPWWTSRPFGFEKNGHHRAGEAAALRQAYADLLNGHRLYGIARRLNDDGHLSPRAGIKRTKKNGTATVDSGLWRSSNLRTVLVNPRNAAIHTYKGQPTGSEATWQPIVSREIYEAAVRLLGDASRKVANDGGKRKGLLTNIAQCGKRLTGATAQRLHRKDGSICGGKMIQAQSRPRKDGSQYAFYRCRECQGVTIPVDFLDSYVMRKMIARAEQWVEQIDPAEDEVTQANVSQLRAEELALQSRKQQLAEMFTDGLVDRQALTAGTEKANARLAEIGQRVADLTISKVSRESLAGDTEYLFHLFDEMETSGEHDALRGIFTTMAEGIVCLPRGKGQRLPKSADVRIVWRERTSRRT